MPSNEHHATRSEPDAELFSHTRRRAHGSLTSIEPSVETGSANEVGSWKEAEPGGQQLQRQLRRMFELVDEPPAQVLSGYFVPFRSREWKTLLNQREALALGKSVWRELLSVSPAMRVLIVWQGSRAACARARRRPENGLHQGRMG